jgi:transposase
MTIIRIGLDTSKHVFQIHGVDENEQPVLRRQNLVKLFAKLAPTRIALEACGAAHHWARVLRGLGHEVVLIPPQYIKRMCNAARTTRSEPVLGPAESQTRGPRRSAARSTG